MGHSAGELIEHAGLKMIVVRSASLFEHDANCVIVADENGSSDDVRRLMDDIREQVFF